VNGKNAISIKVKLIKGSVIWIQDEGISLLPHEIDQGFILPCVCASKTEITIKK